MTWEDALTEVAVPGSDLRPALQRLFARARDHWPLWRDGEAALQSVQVKELRAADGRVLVQTNPRRGRSVHAAVDPASVAARPCFLCPEHLPPGECGVAWSDLALLPNPYPIVEGHLTIPSRRHQPQALVGRTLDLVRLAQDVGRDRAVLYNGPRCGASAPDHFHFQSCADALPAFEQLPPAPPVPGKHPVSSFGRRFLALFDGDPSRLAERIEVALAAWGRVRSDTAEPMCSVLVRWHDGYGTALFFPRRAHRPAAFFATGEQRIAVSPAAIEMAGIMVVTDQASFDRLDAGTARQVFEEVSPTPQQFTAFLEQVP